MSKSDEPQRLNKCFFKHWSTEYQNSEVYGTGYSRILERIPTEKELIDKPFDLGLFMEIIDWKAHRVKTILSTHIKRYGFSQYSDAIRIINKEKSVEYVPYLAGLYGLNYPTASAILHFCSPNLFPIVDIRVTEALIHFKYLAGSTSSFTSSHAGYRIYFNTIHKIAKALGGISLRTLDEALFAYHKAQLQTGNLR